MNVETIKLLREKNKIDSILMKYPGVHSVGIGYKIKKGKRTKEIVIRVHVEKKGQVSKKDMIPKTIFGIPTDVIQSSIPKPTAFQDLSAANLSLLRTPIPPIGTPSPDWNGKSRYRPVIAGVSMSLGSHDPGAYTGTVGLIGFTNGPITDPRVRGLKDPLPGEPVVITNLHIMGGRAVIEESETGYDAFKELNVGEYIIQPGNLDGGKSSDGQGHIQDAIGVVLAWEPFKTRNRTSVTAQGIDSPYGEPENEWINTVDAGIGYINTGWCGGTKVSYDTRIYNPENDSFNYLTGTTDPEIGMVVSKLGRTSGRTVGTITEIDKSTRIWYADALHGIGPGYIYFKDLFEVTNNVTGEPMGRGGDSGAAFITLDYKAVGLLMGAYHGENFGIQGLGCKINTILDKFNLRLDIHAPGLSSPATDDRVNTNTGIGNSSTSLSCSMDSSKITEPVQSCPVLITQANIPDDFWNSIVNEDCSDIIVTDTQGLVQYYREIVYASKTNKILEMWVKVPQVFNSQNTEFKLACGDALASVDYSKTWENCFSSNGDFVAVYHFNRQEDSNPRIDSSRVDGKNNLVINYPANPTLSYRAAKVSGPYGSAFKLNKERYFYASDKEYLTPTIKYNTPKLTDGHWVEGKDTAFSIVAVVRLDGSSSQTNTIVSKGKWDEYELSIVNNRVVFAIYDKDRATLRKFGGTILQNTWYTVVASYDGTGLDGMRVYVNGDEVSLTSTSLYPTDYISITDTGSPLYVGKSAEDEIADITLAELWIMMGSALKKNAASILHSNIANGNINYQVDLGDDVDEELPVPVSGISPIIVSPLAAITTPSGSTVTWRVDVAGTPPLSYQWRHEGIPILGGPNSNSYTLSGVTNEDEGWYTVVVGNAFGFTSSAAVLLVDDIPTEDPVEPEPSGTAPVILTHPSGYIAEISGSVDFKVSASGELLRYYWYHNGHWIDNTDSPVYTVVNVQLENSGFYGCAVSNDYGTAVSSGAYLQVTSGGAPSPITPIEPEDDHPDFTDIPLSTDRDPYRPWDSNDINSVVGNYIKVADSAIAYKNYTARALGMNTHANSVKGCLELVDGTLYAAFFREFDRWVMYKSDDSGFSWNLIGRYKAYDRGGDPYGHNLFLQHSYVDDTTYCFIEQPAGAGGYTWTRYLLPNGGYDSPYGYDSETYGTTYYDRLKDGCFSVCGDPDNRTLVFYTDLDTSRVTALEVDPTLSGHQMIKSWNRAPGARFTGKLDSTSKNDKAWVAAVNIEGNLSVLRYIKGSSGGDGYFDNIAEVQNNLYPIRDISIDIDGKGTLALIYTLEYENDLVNTLALSYDSGVTWEKYDFPKPYRAFTFVDPATGTLTNRLRIMAGAEGGFIIAGIWTDEKFYSNVYVRHLNGLGSEYTLGPAMRMNSKNGPITGCEFFRTSDEKKLLLNNLAGVRMTYLKGRGNVIGNGDTVQTSIFQEKLGNRAYPARLSTDVISYPFDEIVPGALRLEFSVFGAPNRMVDYYNEGVTGEQTNQYIAAFGKIGIPVRLLKYIPYEVATSTGRTAYGSPTEYTTRIIVDPTTYDFPAVARNDEDFKQFIERDIRKVFLPPDFFLDRFWVLNDGGYLKRTVWTLIHMGNEYEISQVVPRFINEQICFYEANAYVIGPSNDPFRKITLPSET